jgi:transcriptional regulator with XRE-family HTH domain
VFKKYKEIRFFLFANSYSGKKIASYLKKKHKSKKSAEMTKRLSRVLGLTHKQVNDFVSFEIKPNPPYKRLPASLKIYLEVENELSKLSEEKLDEYSTSMDDYQKRLLYPAIERAVGNLLENIEDDNKFQKLFEEKFKTATHTYYKVAYKYKLPTIRVVPFILRLILS